MVVVVAVTALFGLSFTDFMLLYVLAYFVHAILFEACFRRLSGRTRQRVEALA